MKRRTVAALAATTIAALVLSGCSKSSATSDGSDYPTKDITLIVQAKAGGGSDTSSRALAKQMEPILGKSIVVENRPGASGSTAMLYVKDQKADGYTIGFAPVEIAMLGSMNYTIKPSDFDMLGQIMLGPGVISVPADSPYNSLKDLVEGAKTKELTVANSGAGSIWELATLGLKESTGAKLKPVPFDGGAPAVAAVLGNQVDAAVSGVAEVKQNLADKKLKVLAVFHSERIPGWDVPTAKEQGYDLEFGGWGGIYAPKGLPDAVKKKLEETIKTAANSAEFKDILSKSGNLPVYRSSADFTTFADGEFARFAKLLGKG